LETNDLAAALEPVYSNSIAKPDLSQLKGMQAAIAVMAIEISEKKVSDEESMAEIKPRFVAVIDTHAWHFQAVRFAEEQLGAIVEKFYGSKPQIQDPERNGGRDITWTESDGRKAFAFVRGGIVYFSNDRESLDKCLALEDVAATLASANKVQPTPPDTLASGYVSQQGIGQIADVIALRAASASEDAKVRSGVASILPQLVRELVTEIRWTERRSGEQVSDVYQVSMPENVVAALNGTAAGELHERLKNSVIKLLDQDKSSPAVKAEIADIVTRAMLGEDTSGAKLTASGIEQTTISQSGKLAGLIHGMSEAAAEK
jgi:hypothetical protein